MDEIGLKIALKCSEAIRIKRERLTKIGPKSYKYRHEINLCNICLT